MNNTLNKKSNSPIHAVNDVEPSLLIIMIVEVVVLTCMCKISLISVIWFFIVGKRCGCWPRNSLDTSLPFVGIIRAVSKRLFRDPCTAQERGARKHGLSGYMKKTNCPVAKTDVLASQGTWHSTRKS